MTGLGAAKRWLGVSPRLTEQQAPAGPPPLHAAPLRLTVVRLLAALGFSSIAAFCPLVLAQAGGAVPATPTPADPAPAEPAPSDTTAEGGAAAAAAGTASRDVLLDRIAVRFTAPETGGITKPQFIFERELAFEARLEALTDAGFRQTAETPYLERHVRAALERHMAEVLLQSLEVTPEPTARDLELRLRSARLTLEQQLGGAEALEQASRAESISATEVAALLRRRARASLYLDRMVATMLTPSDTELRIVHRTTRTPFSGADYESVAPLLSRWYVAQRLNTAVRAFYEGARSRLSVTLLIGNARDPGGRPREGAARDADTSVGEPR